jgi:ribose/xylose/arabinose/galactoside ABC-type transport system permease subunit
LVGVLVGIFVGVLVGVFVGVFVGVLVEQTNNRILISLSTAPPKRRETRVLSVRYAKYGSWCSSQKKA